MYHLRVMYSLPLIVLVYVWVSMLILFGEIARLFPLCDSGVILVVISPSHLFSVC